MTEAWSQYGDDGAARATRVDRDVFGRPPRGRPDWSHRRGEPRVFALLWMCYLMGATATMFAALSDAFFVSPAVTRPAGRGMLVAAAAGVAFLWPAMRLSQRPAERPVAFVLRDLFVLLLPAQAMVWPHALKELGDWPLPVLGALSACLAAWALLVGGLIALADSGRFAGRWRGLWMAGVVLVCTAAPAWGAAFGVVGPRPAGAARAGWMLSPFTAVLELTRPASGPGGVTPITGTHCRLIAAPGLGGGALLVLAAAAGVAARRGRA